MSRHEGIDYFVYILFPLLVLVFGLVGNFAGFFLMSRSKLVKLTTRNVYRFLFCTDTSILIQILVAYMQLSIEIDPTVTSNLFCKIFSFFNYALGPISSLLIVYISCERYISVKSLNGNSLLTNVYIQALYLAAVLAFNFLYYLGIAFYFEVQETFVNSTNGSDIQNIEFCTFIDVFSLQLYSYMDLVNRAMVPFLLMIISSIMLTYSLFSSRKKIASADTKRLRKDLKFTTSSIFLNLVYIFLQMPVSVTIFMPNYWESTLYVFSLYLFYASYSVNFYIMLIFNSIFRQQFLILIGLRKDIRLRKEPSNLTTAAN